MQRRRLLDGDAALTTAGADLRDEIEAATDRLAAAPWADVEPGEMAMVVSELDAAARAVLSAGEIPFPNPMGLPSLAVAEAR